MRNLHCFQVKGHFMLRNNKVKCLTIKTKQMRTLILTCHIFCNKINLSAIEGRPILKIIFLRFVKLYKLCRKISKAKLYC